MTYQRGGLKVTLRRVNGWTLKGVLAKPFVFQCPPTDSFALGGEHSHTDYDTIGAGQLSRPGVKQLRTVNFSTLFVDYGPPWSFIDTEPLDYSDRTRFHRGDTLNPKEAQVVLERILDSGTPFRLTAFNETLWETPDIDMYATLRTITGTERAGEVDARYFDVAFREFRSPSLPVLRGNPSVKLPASVLVRSLPKGRRTIAQLAKYYYGSASRAVPIRKANKVLAPIGNNVDLVKHFAKRPTLKLRIPKV